MASSVSVSWVGSGGIPGGVGSWREIEFGYRVVLAVSINVWISSGFAGIGGSGGVADVVSRWKPGKVKSLGVLAIDCF